MIKYLLITIAVLMIAFIGVKHMLTPFERNMIDEPIYTIGGIDLQRCDWPRSEYGLAWSGTLELI